jgi:hypothetical protein
LATRILSFSSNSEYEANQVLQPMTSIAVIRSQIERRIPGALTVYERQKPELFPTGIAALDQQVGGIPKGGLTQICAPAGNNSGRTTLLMSLLAQVTREQEEFCSVIDATDCFDPESASKMGVCFSRLLWSRCGDRGMKALERSFRATDILIQNGGFGVIVLNLSYIEEKLIRKIPHTSWFCLARKIERTSTAFVGPELRSPDVAPWRLTIALARSRGSFPLTASLKN